MLDPDTPTPDSVEPSSLRRPLEAGQRIGRFAVLGTLGKGGMGILYEAYDPELDRKVALKLVRPGRLPRSKTSAGRLLREAQALARLSHPNVVAVYDVGTFGNQVFLALEHIDGVNLDEWTADQVPPVERTVEVFVAAGRGLVAAHAAGMLHRDIKPSNIMVGPGDRVRLVDFGLVRALEEVESRVDAEELALHSPMESPELSTDSDPFATPLTRQTSLMGTPSYMAPEQLQDRPATERTDQFSFCVSLYRVLYGRLPYAVDHLGDLLRERKREELELSPQGLGQPIPQWVRNLLARGLDPDPERRFPSMDALVTALESDPLRQRRRWLGFGVGLLLAVLVTAGVVGWWGSQVESCNIDRTRLSEVWGESQRVDLAKAFRSLGTPLADSTWPMVEHGLDDYSAVWGGAFNDACEATYRRGTQSEELFDLRSACLEDRLMDFEALIQLFQGIDTDMVEEATKAITGLPEVTPCADGRALRAIAPLEPLPEDAESLRWAKAILSKARAQSLAGQFQEARESLQPLLNSIDGGDLVTLEAAVVLETSHIEARLGNYEVAREQLLRVLNQALAKSQDDLVVEALFDLATIEGSFTGLFDKGFEWLNMAKAMGQRLGHRPVLEVKAQMAAARLSYQAGEFEASEDAFRNVLQSLGSSDLSEQSLGGVAVADLQGVAAMGLAAVLNVTGRSEEALQAYDQALEKMTQVSGEKHPRVAEILFNRGNALLRVGRVDEAEDAFRVSIERLKESLGDRHPRVGVPINNLGVILEGRGDLAGAAALYTEALAIARDAYPEGHVETARALYNLAQIKLLLDERVVARRLVDESLAMLERLVGTDHPENLWPQVVRARLDIGDGFPARAIGPLTNALASADELGATDLAAELSYYLAQALWDSGRDRPRALELAGKSLDWIETSKAALAGSAAAESTADEIRRWLNAREG